MNVGGGRIIKIGLGGICNGGCIVGGGKWGKSKKEGAMSIENGISGL